MIYLLHYRCLQTTSRITHKYYKKKKKKFLPKYNQKNTYTQLKWDTTLTSFKFQTVTLNLLT